MLRVAVVRGEGLNKWEMQGYEHLLGRVKLTAVASTHTAFDVTDLTMPIRRLPSPDYYLKTQRLLRGTIGKELWSRVGLNYMFGLQDVLADFDIAHVLETSSAMTYQAARARKADRRLRVISSCWETIPFIEYELPRTRARKVFVKQHIDRYLAMTQRARNALLLEGVAADRITVQYPCIDLTRFHPAPRTHFDKDGLWRRPEALRILFVGSITGAKGIRDYLRAVAILHTNPYWRGRLEFAIVGRGDLAPIIPLVTTQLGLEGVLHYLPFVPYDRMPDLYASTDIFVLPSISTPGWEEQFGMVLAESMACARAVVTTYSGAIPEVVGDAAVLVPSSDADSLAHALDELLRDDRRREQLGHSGYARAHDLFSPDLFSSALLKLYEEVVA